MVNIVIKELQMVFLTSTVTNSNGNMKELECKIKDYRGHDFPNTEFSYFLTIDTRQ